ncbi:hypothetical protein SAMD00019534_071720, partial [Acytostelium subglobosum LB1]|uniref:hypothetical protein n=1 Tax=Acytostelium subglobosum LB1 TaxID=1410327 RepID=UPI000644A336
INLSINNLEMGKGDTGKSDIKSATAEMKNEFKAYSVEAADNIQQEVHKTFDDVKSASSKAVNDAKDVYGKTVNEAKDAFGKTKAQVEQKAANVKSDIEKEINKAKDSVAEAKKEAEKWKSSAERNVEAAKEKLSESAQTLKDNAQNLIKTSNEDIQQIKEGAQNVAKKVENMVQDGTSGLKKSIGDNIGYAKEKIQEGVESLKNMGAPNLDQTGSLRKEWEELDRTARQWPQMLSNSIESAAPIAGAAIGSRSWEGWHMDKPSSDPDQDFVDGKLVKDWGGQSWSRGGFNTDRSINTDQYKTSSKIQERGTGLDLRHGVHDLQSFVDGRASTIRQQVAQGSSMLENQMYRGIDDLKKSSLNVHEELKKNAALLNEQLNAGTNDLENEVRLGTLDLLDKLKRDTHSFKKSIKQGANQLQEKVNQNANELHYKIHNSIETLDGVATVNANFEGLKDSVKNSSNILGAEADRLHNKMHNGSVVLEKNAQQLQSDIEAGLEKLRQEALLLQKKAADGAKGLQVEAVTLQGEVDTGLHKLKSKANELQLKHQGELKQFQQQLAKEFEGSLSKIGTIQSEIKAGTNQLQQQVRQGTAELQGFIKKGSQDLKDLADNGAGLLEKHAQIGIDRLNEEASKGYTEFKRNVHYVPPQTDAKFNAGQEQWGTGDRWFGSFISTTNDKIGNLVNMTKEETEGVTEQAKSAWWDFSSWGWSGHKAEPVKVTSDFMHQTKEIANDALTSAKEIVVDTLETIQKDHNNNYQQTFDALREVPKIISNVTTNVTSTVNNSANNIDEKISETVNRSVRSVNRDYWNDLDHLNKQSGALYAALGGVGGSIITSSMFVENPSPLTRYGAILGLAGLGGWYGLTRPHMQERRNIILQHREKKQEHKSF